MRKGNSGDTVIKRSRGKEIWRLFRKNRPAMVGLVLLVIILLVAIFADVIVPYDKALEVSSDYLQPPSSEHIFGTDNVGRDLFARVIHGSRYSLVIGIVADMSSLVIPNDMRYASALAILIIVLLVRPQGIFGKQQRVG